MVFKVADISLAAFGRKEIEIAEVRVVVTFSRDRMNIRYVAE
jgi:S-adenosylhomocysteine hydrolase